MGVEQHVQRPGAAVDAEVLAEDRAVGVELERQWRGADAAHDLDALEDGDVAVAGCAGPGIAGGDAHAAAGIERRSEEHTSALQSLMRISYAVFCWKKKNKHKKSNTP